MFKATFVERNKVFVVNPLLHKSLYPTDSLKSYETLPHRKNTHKCRKLYHFFLTDWQRVCPPFRKTSCQKILLKLFVVNYLIN